MSPRMVESAGTGIGLPVLMAGVFAGADLGRIFSAIAAIIVAVGYIARFFLETKGLWNYNRKQDARIAELEEKLKKLEGKP